MTIQCLAHGVGCLHCGIACGFEDDLLRKEIARIQSEIESSKHCYQLLNEHCEKQSKELGEANRIIEEYKYRDKAGEVMCNESFDEYEKEIERIEAELATANEKIEKARKNLKELAKGCYPECGCNEIAKEALAALGEKDV